MSHPVVVGITGRYGTGKDTLAGMLAESIPGAQITHLATPLKGDVHKAFRAMYSYELTAEQIASLKGSCLGPMYQGWGELCRQVFGRNFWVKNLERRLPTILADVVIVPDVRYPIEEAAWVKERGLLVAIYGPCRRDGDTRSTTHPSEARVEMCQQVADYKVLNSGDVDQLRVQANRIAFVVNGMVSSRAV